MTDQTQPSQQAQQATEPVAAEPEARDARGRVAELRALREKALEGPSERATQAQHAKGKLTVRERIELLLDEGSFCEVEPLRRHRATGFGLEEKKPYTDGVVTGWGLVHGRTVFVYAHDFRIFGGALGEAHATKIHKIMDMAIAAGAPLISLNDGAGARMTRWHADDHRPDADTDGWDTADDADRGADRVEDEAVAS
jgi:acetyl-CoA carboxylase carboxyltransferase component